MSERIARGDLFVVSAPSGTGKTTVCRALCQRMKGVQYSISCTTRPPRPGEEEGTDYFFVSEEIFQEMVEKGEFLEWAQVYGFRYGTPRRWVEEMLGIGLDVLMDVDVQGAKKISGTGLPCQLIFMLPPSWEELKERLSKRGRDSQEEIRLRLQWAQRELGEWKCFDYVIVNDRLDDAIESLKAIIIARRATRERMRHWIERHLDRWLPGGL